MDRQEHHDTFYFRHGPCCAGCDWWHSINSAAGECRRSAPLSGNERAALLGISNLSLNIGAGHALTTQDHHCGEFRDCFDWNTLPLPYLKRIGAPLKDHERNTPPQPVPVGGEK